MPRRQFSHVSPPAPPNADNVYPQFGPEPTEPEDWQDVSFYLPRRSTGLLAGAIVIPVIPSGPGNFTVAHGLGQVPALVLLDMTSAGEIWFQPTRYDDTDIKLVASAAGVTAIAYVFPVATFVELPLTPSAGGDFSVPHGLSGTPALVEVQMTSGGAIWCQSTPADGTNVNLVASAGGVTGYAIVWLTMPAFVVSDSVSIALTPSAPGPFQVAHGLAGVPDLVLIQMRSGGAIWLQQPVYVDETYIYLEASAGGIVGNAQAWTNGGGSSSGGPAAEIEFATSAGDFTVAHGLPFTPGAVVAQLDDFGAVAFRKVGGVRWDATNVYLKGSAAGLAGFLEVWK